LPGRHIATTKPAHKITKFGASSATSTLRRHLAEEHLYLWVSGCDNLNIKIQAKTVQKAVDEYRKARGQPTAPHAPDRQPYSNAGFVDAIVEFIVGDDQVWDDIYCDAH
jgi:hypothetical protein